MKTKWFIVLFLLLCGCSKKTPEFSKIIQKYDTIKSTIIEYNSNGGTKTVSTIYSSKKQGIRNELQSLQNDNKTFKLKVEDAMYTWRIPGKTGIRSKSSKTLESTFESYRSWGDRITKNYDKKYSNKKFIGAELIGNKKAYHYKIKYKTNGKDIAHIDAWIDQERNLVKMIDKYKVNTYVTYPIIYGDVFPDSLFEVPKHIKFNEK